MEESRLPKVGHQQLDLYLLYTRVQRFGGFAQVCRGIGFFFSLSRLYFSFFFEVVRDKKWKRIADMFEFPATCTNGGYTLKQVYLKHLVPYEDEYAGFRVKQDEEYDDYDFDEDADYSPPSPKEIQVR